MSKPAAQEDKKPRRQKDKGTVMHAWDAAAILSSSKLLPPIIVGIESKNENLTALAGSHPNMRAQEIVEALREMPGMRAVDCIVPIHSASLIARFIESFFSRRSRKVVPRNKMPDVAIKHMPRYSGREQKSRSGFSRK